MTSVVSITTLMGPLLSSIAVQFWSFENFYSAYGFIVFGCSILYTVVFSMVGSSSRKSSLEDKLLKKDDDVNH